jgi:preprotein translocase SecE subunit
MSKPLPSSTPLPKSGRGGIRGYFGEVARELRKVQWPTPKETTRLTGVVLAVCGICLVAIWILAFLIASMMSVITGR